MAFFMSRCRPGLRMILAFAAVISASAGMNAEEAAHPPQTSVCLMIESAARANDLPVEFFARLIWRESSFDPEAVGPVTRSGAQAQGIAQFMPGTASERSLLDPFDPIQALPKAAEFLKELQRRFGNIGLAAAAYNAGPRRVAEWLAGEGYMPSETQNYVLAITGLTVQDWAAGTRQTGVGADSVSCDQMVRRLKQAPRTFVTALSERAQGEAAKAWGVQLSAGFSRDSALEKYAESVRRFSQLLAGRDPIVVSAIMRSRGTRPFYQVRVGAETRAEAEQVCRQLRAANGACMVLRNGRHARKLAPEAVAASPLD